MSFAFCKIKIDEFPISVLASGGGDTRADWVHKRELGHLLAALTPDNRLALEVSLATGLRISDVLGIKTEAVRSSKDGRISIRELKTGKIRRVKLNAELQERMLKWAGTIYIFPHRYTGKRHRTRQAVGKDLRRVAKAFRLKENITPHSARKAYAVEAFKRSGDLKRIQRLLNHESEAVTVLYAMADRLMEKHFG